MPSPITRPDQYEFGGPIGATLTVILLPPLMLILSHWTEVGYVDLDPTRLKQSLIPSENVMLYCKCGLGLLVWFLSLIVLWVAVPGEIVYGSPVLQAQPRHLLIPYKLNGHSTFWIVVGIYLILRPPLQEWFYANWNVLSFMASVETFLASCYLYVESFRNPSRTILSRIGNSGWGGYDFWMGRELNPSWESISKWTKDRIPLDWKEFCELRPGLMLWMWMNLACAQEQYQRLGYITASMLWMNLLQAFYVWDALYQERAILTTMDITTDGFGFMLVFGDLAWVPFTYSLPAKYLVEHDPHLSNFTICAILTLYLLGFYIFRASNGQKDKFRRNPQAMSHMTYLQTKRGTKLLTSGWWGLARKINYTGDWIMGLSYCLLCGCHSIVPYYYAVYFAILLIHRSMRDDELCHQKYGDDWTEYKRQVPYRFIPGIL